MPLLLLLLLCVAVPVRAQQTAEPPLRPEDTPALPAEDETAETTEQAEPAPPAGQPVANWLEAQVELHRRGFSCGSLDGVRGLQTAAALKAWQKNEGLRETGDLDRATKAALLISAPALTDYIFSTEDSAATAPVPDTWLGKSELDALRHATPLEMIAERFRANPKLLIKLNPDVNWDDLLPGTKLVVPSADPAIPAIRIARIHIYLAEKVLQAVDETGRVLLHTPVSIARNVEKRPVGELHVTVVIPDPNYTFDPAVFPEVPEAQELGRKLIIAPGPNNPVGVAWIGLDRTGYGIHGTPDPEKVGRTESHGCFRLANWDARVLVRLAWVGLPITVDE